VVKAIPARDRRHDFESLAEILKRMKLNCERRMTNTFDPALSLELDAIDAEQQRLDEARQR